MSDIEDIADNLLDQAYGPDLGRMIAGGYRLAMTAASLKIQLDAATQSDEAQDDALSGDASATP
jgi:hypothetical protein